MADEGRSEAMSEQPPREVEPVRPRALGTAIGVTTGSLVLLAAKLGLEKLDPALRLDDALTVGLVVMAMLPWFARLLSSAKLPGGWELEFRDIKASQERQSGVLATHEEQIRALRTAIRGIVTEYEHEKLVHLSRDGPFPCEYSADLCDELKRLRALGLIRHHEGTGLVRMAQAHGPGTAGGAFDLKQFFFITEDGRRYLTLRDQAVAGVP